MCFRNLLRNKTLSITILNVSCRMHHSKSLFLSKYFSRTLVRQWCCHQRTLYLQCLSVLSLKPVSPVLLPVRHESTKSNPELKKRLKDGPSLHDFLIKYGENVKEEEAVIPNVIPYINNDDILESKRSVYFDIKGCQMNVSDAEVAWSILKKAGYSRVDTLESADVILLITCAIREHAENKVWNQLHRIKGLKKNRHIDAVPLKVGVLGCMAERLKEKLLEKEKIVDIVAGPDSYRDLPRLLSLTENNQKAINVLLSFDETYADVTPVRLNKDPVSAYVSIMRGCDNMCTYCIVPFTRGRERSRPMESILQEIRQLSDEGIKCVTLLGQNVNSYCDRSAVDHFGGLDPSEPTHLAKGFKTVYKSKKGGTRFADLLDKVSQIDPEMRIQFTSPHPKDFPDEVLELVRERSNIPSWLHLPAQSGNNEVLERMRRGYTREAYLDLVAHVQEIIPNIALTSDFIAGFCGETEEQFEDTLKLFYQVPYAMAFLFKYSLREKTTAHRRYLDDVPEEVKVDRHRRMTEAYMKTSSLFKKRLLGSYQLVLVEGKNKFSEKELCGRSDGNIKVTFPKANIPDSEGSAITREVKPGDYVVVQIENTTQSLHGKALYHTTLSKGSQRLDEIKRQETLRQ